MVLRNGYIMATNIDRSTVYSDRLVYFDSNGVPIIGNLIEVDDRYCKIDTQQAPFFVLSEVPISSVKEIVIGTKEPVNDIKPINGMIVRPLKYDQWNYALSRFELSGIAEPVQFGVWKETENSDREFFQLPLVHQKQTDRKVSRDELIFNLSREVNERGQFKYLDLNEILIQIKKFHS